jgi:hypothetical protein
MQIPYPAIDAPTPQNRGHPGNNIYFFYTNMDIYITHTENSQARHANPGGRTGIIQAPSWEEERNYTTPPPEIGGKV